MAKVNNMICAAAPGDVFLIIELKKRLARIGIRRPNSQLGPALRLTTGRDDFYIYTPHGPNAWSQYDLEENICYHNQKNNFVR